MTAEDKLRRLKELLQERRIGSPARVHYSDWDTYTCTSCYAEEALSRDQLRHEDNCAWKLIDELLSEVAQG